ncbi:chemotaxis protein methyltransferase CheR [Marinitoga hydrogenitolerans DSM 16785]|uniref:protein-glutamate O-methyltransferase n=1 Tax=Marinitoga hydrogenitolerans (strain DSM 16785 / JCM 12826 / AT1271) TaxID=1122195 RepID=A0A1M4UJ80_MARH1|nr:protein-glutamate O-methyltransferase CheR [Marinitoga hydrogenitolerans]SHE56708.1 chemotaxis protein methyltransferase CheR [Marinitoga hydrogenitolerans DSM 16785]
MINVLDFNQIRDYIYSKTGIYIEDKRIYYFKNRILRRMKKLAINDLMLYFNFLKYSEYSEIELSKLINEITVNETYFFREFQQLQTFAEYALKDVLSRKNNRIIKVLSAGCASGEEPYTISIILNEMLESKYTFKIDAFDIDNNMIKKAKIGIYNKYAVRDVPKEYLKKYFEKTDDGLYKIREFIKKNVNIYNLNMIEDTTYERLDKDYDFIFCRNVFIYFTDDIRRKIIERFYFMLNDGGYIFLGHSESINRITNAFQIVKANDFILYRKPFKEGENNA